MGVALPGAIAVQRVHPICTIVTGDVGFLMNSQKVATAIPLVLARVILVWNDSEYGLIKQHQLKCYGGQGHIRFGNPGFVKYIECSSGKGL